MAPSASYLNPENHIVYKTNQLQVARENSLIFSAEDRAAINSFFEGLNTLFAEKHIQADFEKLTGIGEIKRDYDPPLKYYSA